MESGVARTAVAAIDATSSLTNGDRRANRTAPWSGGRGVRALFVSDAHFGCKYAHSQALLDLLNECQPDRLYLVGDIVDGWRLRKVWYWNDTYNLIIQRVIEMTKAGAKVHYTPGNHDEFLRGFIYNLGLVEIADEFVHEAADGRKILVTHGDKFDLFVERARWLSFLGDMGYNILLKLNYVFNLARRRLGFGYWSLSKYIKKKVKQATNAINNFENLLTDYAVSKGCEGVICGHIHTAAMLHRNGITYYNTGDWVESCTALVEYDDGALELIHRPILGPR